MKMNASLHTALKKSFVCRIIRLPHYTRQRAVATTYRSNIITSSLELAIYSRNFEVVQNYNSERASFYEKASLRGGGKNSNGAKETIFYTLFQIFARKLCQKAFILELARYAKMSHTNTWRLDRKDESGRIEVQ